MSEQYAPVRAWAEWDDATAYMHQMHDPPGKFTRWEIPKGATGDPLYSTHFDGVEEFVRRTSQKYGPLRSLRVLFNTGQELYVGCIATVRSWELFRPAGVAAVASGWCKGATDEEAVAYALDEAQRWLAERQGA